MLHVELFAGTRRLYDGEAQHVVLPGEEGELSVLDCHAPMVCALSAGLVQIDEQAFPVDGGVASVWKNRVIIVGP